MLGPQCGSLLLHQPAIAWICAKNQNRKYWMHLLNAIETMSLDSRVVLRRESPLAWWMESLVDSIQSAREQTGLLLRDNPRGQSYEFPVPVPPALPRWGFVPCRLTAVR